MTNLVDRFSPEEEIRFEVRQVLFEATSPYQDIQVVELALHGRALVLDGNVQSCEADEHFYHEALVHPALLSIPDPGPKSVLILGGGEGATLREVLKHQSVERAVMVDLDRAVVEACREHLPGHHRGAFDDPRAEVVCEDADAFLRRTDERFDAIVFDIIDPADEGPAVHLFSAEFFARLRARLAPGGVLAMQYGAVFGDHVETAARIARRLGDVFGSVRCGRVFIPSFHGSWGILVAGERPPTTDPGVLDARIGERMREEPRAADGEWIRAILTLPRDIREVVQPPPHAPGNPASP